MWSVSVSEAEQSSGSAVRGTTVAPGTWFFSWSPGTGAVWWVATGIWLAEPVWLASQSRTEGGCWEAGGQQQGLARSTWVPSGDYGGVKRCNSSCWLWKPSPESLKSQACTCAAAQPIPQGLYILLLFPQPPCGPLSCHPPPPFQTSLSPACSPISWCVCPFPFILLAQPKFPSSCPLPPSPLSLFLSHSACLWARLGRERCARRNQITISMWFIGMTVEVPKSDTVQVKLNVRLRSQFFL